MGKTLRILGTMTLAATAGVLGAQSTPPDSIPPAQAGQVQAGSAQTGSAAQGNTEYATGKPLATQSNEGFFGHLNPFARKKWVHRQVDPLKDQVNELDELQARNANDIRDVDARATRGINGAMTAANAADTQARAAGDQAAAANSLAVSADARTTSLNGTVSNLDQYQSVKSSAVAFTAGRTELGPKGKATLDDLATQLASEKGYIVEVQGFSRAGVTRSTEMADAVVRYLVEAHQVPIYRIYRTGLGKQTSVADGETAIPNGVRVTLLQNSLANMNAPSSSAPAAAGGAGEQ